jgi:DNA-directed RNA polymerase specialized sigma24 family protein
MTPVKDLTAFIRSFLYKYGYTGIDAAEVLGPATIMAIELHGEQWDHPRWFYSAISSVLKKEVYYRRSGRETKKSIRATAYLSDTLPGDDGYSSYDEVLPASRDLEPEWIYLHNENLDNLLRLAEIDSRVALRLYEELGYTHEELSEITGLSEHQIRLRSGSTVIVPQGAQTVCVSCRKPREVNEEYLCKDCRIDVEFETLPTRKKVSGGKPRGKRPWLNSPSRK